MTGCVLFILAAMFLDASPTWWGFAVAQDRQKVDGYLHCSTWARFCSKHSSNFRNICMEADQNLFCKVFHNPEHVLHQLLSASTHSYSLRARAHNWQLPLRLSHLVDCDFIMCMPFCQSYWYWWVFTFSFIVNDVNCAFVCFNVRLPVYFLCSNCSLSVTNKHICYVIICYVMTTS